MINKDNFGDRIKGYENITRYSLIKRIPVIIRIDGKAFHTFTKHLTRPFCVELTECMKETTKELIKSIQGCKLAYSQSDEISLLITDYENINTSAWFDYTLQKIVSVSASIATAAFNKFWIKNKELDNIQFACFDSRAFNLAKEEVCNYFIWRQQDAIRNSIQMLAQANFSHKELQNKNCKTLKEMLINQKNINWDNIQSINKKGFCVYKENTLINHIVTQHGSPETEPIYRNITKVDIEIPNFNENRNYIEKWI